MSEKAERGKAGDSKITITPLGPSSGQNTTAAHTMFAHRLPSGTPVDGAMQNFHRKPPAVKVKGFPEKDERVASNVNNILQMLNYYVRCFEADVQLYEWAADQVFYAVDHKQDGPEEAEHVLELTDGWVVVAARDGAMSIYHFGKTLFSLDDTLAKSDVLGRYVSRDIRRDARRMFEAAFPDFVRLRHGTAHSGDRAKNAETASRHSAKAPLSISQLAYETAEGVGLDVMLTDVLSDRQYSVTWENKVHSYQISLETLRTLAAVRDKVYEAFPNKVQEEPLF